jgi:hypothetical protein
MGHHIIKTINSTMVNKTKIITITIKPKKLFKDIICQITTKN